jgi:hypothetical protein
LYTNFATKGDVRVRLEQALRLIFINRPDASYGQVDINSYESFIEDEIDVVEEVQENKFHTFEPLTMTRYIPVETEEKLETFSDDSIGENAQSSIEGSAVYFDNLNTRDHLRLRDYTVDERPNLQSILTFSKLSELMQRTPPRRLAQSHENG